MSKPKSRLIVRFRGGIGDTVQYLSLMRDVRRTYQEYWIECAIASSTPYLIRELVEVNSYIDKIKILAEIDSGFNVSLSFQKKINNFIAQGDKFLDFVYPDFGDTLLFEREIPWQLEFFKEEIDFAEDFTKKYIGNRGLITLHPVSLQFKGPEWRWGEHQYRQLVNLILRDYPHQILLVGDMSISGLPRNRIIDLTSNRMLGISMRKLLATIAKSDLFIGVDSGFAQVAWLSGKKAIAMTPSENLEQGLYKHFIDGKCFSFNVYHWYPKNMVAAGDRIIFPLETTTPENIFLQINKMSLKRKTDLTPASDSEIEEFKRLPTISHFQSLWRELETVGRGKRQLQKDRLRLILNYYTPLLYSRLFPAWKMYKHWLAQLRSLL
jgi:ADP-heptose:LPS heptosyltransferase